MSGFIFRNGLLSSSNSVPALCMSGPCVVPCALPGPGMDGVRVHLGLSHVWSLCEVLFVLSFWSSRNGSREAVKCVFRRESRATEQETGRSLVNDCLDVPD